MVVKIVGSSDPLGKWEEGEQIGQILPILPFLLISPFSAHFTILPLLLNLPILLIFANITVFANVVDFDVLSGVSKGKWGKGKQGKGKHRQAQANQG